MTRACATCGQLFHADPRTPTRRYCTPRCRAADWRHRHASNGANATNDAPNAVPPANAVPNGADGASRARHALARCPHCHTPVAVLTLLVPPAAAHVTPPQAGHG